LWDILNNYFSCAQIRKRVRRHPDSLVLPKHSKVLKIADILMKRMIPVDLRGGTGVGKTAVLNELVSFNPKDINLTFQCTDTFGHSDLVDVVSKMVKEKEKSKRSLYPLRGNLRGAIHQSHSSSLLLAVAVKEKFIYPSIKC
jgi:hypothetical protein